MTGRQTALWVMLQAGATKQMKLPITYDYNDYGVSYVEMVINYCGRLGYLNEKTLADLREDHSMTSLMMKDI